MSVWSRADRSFLSRWWWTVDRVSLMIMLALLGFGLALILAASPAIADKLNLERYHFVQRQLVFAGPAMAIVFAVSLMSLDKLKRLALGLFVISLAGVIATHFVAPDIKGAQRWISLGGFGIQPSEFVKPALVVLLAWILSERSALQQTHKYIAATALAGLSVLPVALQPDFGQTALIICVWATMMFLAGLPMIWIGALAGLGVMGVVFIYSSVSHVAHRIDGFLDPRSADTYQVDMALKAFSVGGLTGQGMGEGQLKTWIPDAHTDFIFAVAGEEYGFFVCLTIVALFGALVVRGLLRAMKEPDHFVQLAAAGLVLLIGLQAFINLGVNTRLLPAKGMTLPFISYGGSSLMATAIVAGLLLACTRRRVRGGLPRHLEKLGAES